jgi:hypothetical protein
LTHSFIRKSDGIVCYSGLIEQRIETIYDKIKYPDSICRFYKSINGQQFHSPFGEIIKKCIHQEIKFSELIEADLLLFYFCDATAHIKRIMPILWCYNDLSDFSFFSQLVYKNKLKYFMELFNVSNKEDLLEKLTIPKEYASQTRYYMLGAPNINDIVNYDLWGTLT